MAKVKPQFNGGCSGYRLRLALAAGLCIDVLRWSFFRILRCPLIKDYAVYNGRYSAQLAVLAAPAIYA